MKIKLFLLLVLFAIHSNTAISQEKWSFMISFGNNSIGPINTLLYLEQDQNNFTLHSSKNGDKRIYGTVGAMLGRLKGISPKKGILLKLTDGTIKAVSKDTDSLFGTFYSPLIGSKPFKGIREKATISGLLYEGTQPVISLEGHSVENEFAYNYEGLSSRINDTTKKYIYNPELLTDKHWKKKIRKMQEFEKQALDDLEVLIYSMMAFRNLPFSHYGLHITDQNQVARLMQPSHNNVSFKEIDPNTVLLEIKSFGGDKEEMDSVFLEISKHDYKNLIVDLRNNPGGGIDAGLAFGNHITDKEINVGYFVTNKWYSNATQRMELESLPTSTAKTTDEFIAELKKSEGKKLVCKPAGRQFRGNIYLLTDNNTGSTCEPIVYALKTNKIAKVIGENTAGQMLSATLINVKDNFWLFMPIADYYTPDKTRLDQIGVAPDFAVPTEEALDFTLKLIEAQGE